jgi:putative transposase
MARLARLALGGYLHHVVQRGHNLQPIFVDAADRVFFLGLLETASRQHGVALHAYALMENHFHLLLTPPTDEALPRMMQTVGRSYVRYFNNRHAHRGTLWEGRYRSTVVQAQRYAMACMVFMDLNPVRAGTVLRSGDYAWSSYGHYAGLRSERLLTPLPTYWALGNTPFAREAAYADLVAKGNPAEVDTAVAQSAIRGWALGDTDFLRELQRRTPRRVTLARPGRPRKSSVSG